MSDKRKITRSRSGCHRCKRLKVKCAEQKPACALCVKSGAECDYSLKLTWGGRPFKAHSNTKTYSTIHSYNGVSQQSVSSLSKSARVHKSSPHQRLTTVKLEPSSLQLSTGTIPETYPVTQTFTGISAHVDTPRYPETQYPETRRPETQGYSAQSDIQHSTSEGETKSHHAEIKTVKRNNDKENGSSLQEDLQKTPGVPLKVGSFGEPENIQSLSSDHQKTAVASQILASPLHINSFMTSPGFLSSDVGSDSLSFDLDNFLTDRENEASSKSFPFQDVPDIAVASRNTQFFNDQISFDYVSIPPSISPEPEILANVPYYRELFHFWINVAADNLVPAPSLYKDNPFKKLLPQMAMHYPGLLTTILAFAARAKGSLSNVYGKNEAVIDHLLKRSCSELIGMLQDKSRSTSDGTLATSLLLSCYEVCHCRDLENHRTHTLGAGQILVERSKKTIALNEEQGSDGDSGSDKSSSSRGSSKKLNRREDDSTFFLARWFIYVDVVGALSSTRNRHNYLRSFRTGQKYKPVETIPNLDRDAEDDHRNIDFLLGFDEKLLPHMVNISLLVDEVENYMNSDQADHSCLPQNIVTAALELKDRFQKDCEAEEAKREDKIGQLIEHGQIETARQTMHMSRKTELSRLVEQNNILRSTNRLYSNMALLNLYRRVLLLPRESHLVQELTGEMAEILRACIEPGSAGDICTIFPTFCAGCDTLDPEKKQFYFERLSHLAQRGNMGANRGIAIMQRCWSTGEDWYTAANMMGLDLVLM